MSVLRAEAPACEGFCARFGFVREVQEPRAIHSSRCGASAPIVVESPWPVWTTVSRRQREQPVRMLSMIVGKSLNDRPVAPGPPLNSVSPQNSTAAVGVVQAAPRRACARACAAREAVPAGRELLAVGELAVGGRSGYTWPHSIAVVGVQEDRRARRPRPARRRR